jgi:hypothetical protein
MLVHDELEKLALQPRRIISSSRDDIRAVAPLAVGSSLSLRHKSMIFEARLVSYNAAVPRSKSSQKRTLQLFAVSQNATLGCTDVYEGPKRLSKKP